MTAAPYCPESFCGWMMEKYIFIGNNGYEAHWFCDRCGYHEKVNE